MSKRGHNIKNEQTKILLSYFDCNNNKIDRVSGVECTATNIPDKNYYTEPIYQVDPQNPSTYAVKKKSRRYQLVPNLMIYNDVNDVFGGAGSSPSYRLPVRLTHCQIEFDVYINSSTTNRVIYNDGDVSTNGNGKNGVGLWVYSSNIMLRWANNSTTATNRTITSLSNVSNKWNHVVIEYIPLSGSCKIDFTISNDISTYNDSVTIVNNAVADERRTVLASSHWSYYQGSQDTVDLFKEVKIYKYE